MQMSAATNQGSPQTCQFGWFEGIDIEAVHVSSDMRGGQAEDSADIPRDEPGCPATQTQGLLVFVVGVDTAQP